MTAKLLLERIEQDALSLCCALGYDLKSIEFASQNRISQAIGFMSPVPDADLDSVGPENFDWIAEQVAKLAIARRVARRNRPRYAPRRFQERRRPKGNGKAMRESTKAGSNQEDRIAKNTATEDSRLEAEVESAAANAEPMGSVAAAVPGDNDAAQDAKATGATPGAESPVIRDQPKTTAGTESKLAGEEATLGSQEAEAGREGKQSRGRKNAA